MGWKDVVLLERDRLTSGTTWHAAGLMVTFGSTSETSTEMRKTRAISTRGSRPRPGRTPASSAPGFIEVASDRDSARGVPAGLRVQPADGIDVKEISPKQVAELFPLREDR